MDSSGSGRKSLGSDVFDFKHGMNILVNLKSQGLQGRSIPSAFSRTSHTRCVIHAVALNFILLSQMFPLKENGNDSVPYLRGIL